MDKPSKSFRDLLVWQKAHELALAIYRVSDAFPADERYGLCSQIRRAAGSVPSNIVEGYRRRTIPDKLRFFNTAQGSADECLYQLILAHDLGYADTRNLQGEIEEVSRLLQGYMNGLKRNS